MRVKNPFQAFLLALVGIGKLIASAFGFGGHWNTENSGVAPFTVTAPVPVPVTPARIVYPPAGAWVVYSYQVRATGVHPSCHVFLAYDMSADLLAGVPFTEQQARTLVSNINSRSSQTGWQAMALPAETCQ